MERDFVFHLAMVRNSLLSFIQAIKWYVLFLVVHPTNYSRIVQIFLVVRAGFPLCIYIMFLNIHRLNTYKILLISNPSDHSMYQMS